MENREKTNENKGGIPLNTQQDPKLVEMQTKMEAGLESMGKTGYLVLQRYNRVGTNYHDYMHTRISGEINGHRVVADKSACLEDRKLFIDIEAYSLLDCSEEENERVRSSEIFLEIDGKDVSSNTETAKKFWEAYSELAFDIDKAKEIEKEVKEERRKQQELEQASQFAEDVLF